MDYTTLGRTGLKVSRLVLGTMNFGVDTSEEDSHAIMDRALELGFNFFDTANVYGWKMGEGVTEQIIGRWLAQGGGRREKIVLATKVYNRMGEGPNEGATLSAYHIRQQCEDSLRRLQTDHIDLYQMHHVDRATPWEEIWQAMEQLVREGKVLYVGSSNFPAWSIMKGNMLAAQRHFLGLVSEQSIYNLSNRAIETEVIPACRECGMGLIPWSPLQSGMLAGVLDRESPGRRSKINETIEKHRDQLTRYEELCRELGEEPAVVGLAWVLSNPVVTGPIVGPRTMEQLESSLRALELKLDEGTLGRLDDIWPGPGGEAPEAYAW
jgi:aryl-alcohol dehydrogenase-like predicted oxidoreductase